MVARVIWLLVAGWVALTLLAYLLADRMIFLPPSASYDAARLPVRTIPVGDGDSLALLHLARGHERFTIIHSHGNAEDLGDVLPLLELIRGAGFAVIAYDYRGYGLSSGGVPGARSADEDALAVYRFAVHELRIPPGRLILHGRSVGAGPALHVAAHHPVGGVILESAFTSAYRVVTRVALLPFDRFPNHRRIRRVRAPVLVIHGTADDVIPIAHGRRLHALAPAPRQAWWVEGAGHNDLAAVAGDGYPAALRAFAELVERTTPAGAEPAEGPGP
jgi:abhydrolase domain-containing protein 17